MGTGGSKSSKNAKAQPIMDGGSYARTMMQAAQKINTSVNSLYKPSHGEKPPELELPKALDDNAQRTSLSKALGVVTEGVGGEEDESGDESSEYSSTSEDEEESGHDEESGDEYDLQQATAKVSALIDALKTEDRTDIMEQLNNWYTARKDTVDDDEEQLAVIEDDYKAREDEMKDCMKDMLQSFEEKQMREVKVLVKCNNTLNAGASNKLKKRRKKFAKGRKKSRKKAKQDDGVVA